MEEWKKWNRNIKKHPFHTSFQPFKVSKRITYASGQIIPEWFKPELKNKNTLLRHILYRRFLKMNTFVAVLGSVRSGKSYFALRYGELYMQEKKLKFNVKTQCSFELLPFFEWSYSAEDSVYIIDELQISSNPRMWWLLQNRVMNQFCDIQGLRRNLLLLPFPHLKYIDKHLRPLINYIVVTVRQGKVKWYKVVSSHIKDKFKPLYIGSINVSLPKKEVIEDYESMKKQFTDEHLNTSIELLKKEKYIPKWDVKLNVDNKFGTLISTRVPHFKSTFKTPYISS